MLDFKTPEYSMTISTLTKELERTRDEKRLNLVQLCRLSREGAVLCLGCSLFVAACFVTPFTVLPSQFLLSFSAILLASSFAPTTLHLYLALRQCQQLQTLLADTKRHLESFTVFSCEASTELGVLQQQSPRTFECRSQILQSRRIVTADLDVIRQYIQS